MAEPTPPLSQESQENQPPPDFASIDHSQSSPVLPSYDSAQFTKPKKPPTITPRTFTRFFTPKSLSTRGTPGASGRALRQISSSKINSRGRRIPIRDEFEDTNDVSRRASKRQRLQPLSPAPSVDLSSPIRRIRRQSLDSLPAESDSEPESVHDDDNPGNETWKMIKRTRIDPLRSNLNRELYGTALFSADSRSRLPRSNVWQAETAGFYTNPGDKHTTLHTEAGTRSIPFFATPCHSKCISPRLMSI